MNIQFSPPDISDLEINEVVKALKSGWITTGPKTKQFEQKIAEYCGTSKAVCLNSATAAMEMVLRLFDVGPGDEVITSVYTYTASASVIDHVGAKIVLVDTAPDSYEMDYEKLAEAITEKTKFIIPVDLGGVMCDFDKLFEAVESKKHLYRPTSDLQKLFDRVVVMADAAHSFGSTYKDKQSGAVADFSCFSFHAVKNLTTAEGGAVTWIDRAGLDNDDLYQQFMLISLHGQSKDALAKMKLGSWEYDIISLAYKCNMTDLTAAFGLAQLLRFESMINHRGDVFKQYREGLRALNLGYLEHDQDQRQGNYHLFMVRVPGISEEKRNEFIIKMAEAGIACNVHFKPLPMHTAYKKLGFDMADFPNAYAQYCNEITLPSHAQLTEEDVKFVVDTFASIINEETLRDNLKYKNFDFERVWVNNNDSIQIVYNLIKECGEEMFIRDGLMHWAEPLPIDTIADECLTKEVYLVKEIDSNKPVAVFNMTDKATPYYDFGKKALYLQRIAVTPELWRNKVGTAIFEWAHNRAKDEGYESIRSVVYSEDPTANAYLNSLGYKILYQRKTKHFVINCMEVNV